MTRKRSSAALIIFTKSEIQGTVKTRMAPPLSKPECLQLHRALVEYTLEPFSAIEAKGIDGYLCVSKSLIGGSFPTSSGSRAAGFKSETQQGPDLGSRLANALNQKLDAGYRYVVLVGTDCPGLGQGHVLQGISLLPEYDLVVGPATDGGFYLAGFSGPWDSILHGINWGTNRVLE